MMQHKLSSLKILFSIAVNIWTHYNETIGGVYYRITEIFHTEQLNV